MLRNERLRKEIEERERQLANEEAVPDLEYAIREAVSIRRTSLLKTIEYYQKEQLELNPDGDRYKKTAQFLAGCETKLAALDQFATA
ncbi:MAG: hypothetical protein EOP50_22880 [Sphingobacteriales bacterium]|nr:MAG: hypothetical protein EOP50_22880 [Sphingobacteriales bacterium]